MDMRRMMSRQLSIIVWIAVLAPVTINAIDNNRFERGATKANKESETDFVSKEGFLVGEWTPVWLAKNPNDGNPVVYSKLPKDTMKRAMIKWVSDGRQTVLLDRSINSYSEETRNDTSKSPSDTGDVIHLSILVVMDYEGNWDKSLSTEKTESRITSMLIYAMAFWNSVDLNLRFLEPKVRIRIAGVVIGDERSATPYIYDNLSPTGVYDAESAILSMQQYWGEVSETNQDFPRNAYDCVVTLTELKHREQIKYNGYELNRALSKNPFKVLSMIRNDDKMFFAVPEVGTELLEIVSELPLSERQKDSLMNLVLLDPASPHLQFRYFSVDTNRFFAGMSKPKEYHDPGKPLETILPGQVSTGKQQCISRHPDINDVCWKSMTCEHLTCSGKGIECKSFGPPADGTTCSRSMICLAGKCISEFTLPMD